MNRITFALLSLALAGLGCAKDQAPAGTPRTTSPPPAGKGGAHASVQQAVDAWRGQKAIAGKYRTVYDTVLLLGEIVIKCRTGFVCVSQRPARQRTGIGPAEIRQQL